MLQKCHRAARRSIIVRRRNVGARGGGSHVREF
jgi:hypothetical protein